MQCDLIDLCMTFGQVVPEDAAVLQVSAVVPRGLYTVLAGVHDVWRQVHTVHFLYYSSAHFYSSGSTAGLLFTPVYSTHCLQDSMMFKDRYTLYTFFTPPQVLPVPVLCL